MVYVQQQTAWIARDEYGGEGEAVHQDALRGSIIVHELHRATCITRPLDRIHQLLPAHLPISKVLKSPKHTVQPTLPRLHRMWCQLSRMKQLLAQRPKHLRVLKVLLARRKVLAKLVELLAGNGVAQRLFVLDIRASVLCREEVGDRAAFG